MTRKVNPYLAFSRFSQAYFFTDLLRSTIRCSWIRRDALNRGFHGSLFRYTQFSGSGSATSNTGLSCDERVQNLFLSGQNIEYSELKQLIESGKTGAGKEFIILDVRNPEETSAGMIPTAVALPLSEMTEAFAQPNMQFQLLYQFPKPSRESTNLIIYCLAGKRSEMAVKLARELGFKRVRNYSGSYQDWIIQENLPKGT